MIWNHFSNSFQRMQEPKKKFICLPCEGECVDVEYISIDEIEIVCWLIKYQYLGYMDNVNLFLKLSDKERKGRAYVSYIDSETGRIDLVPPQVVHK